MLTGLTALRRHGFRALQLQERGDDRRTPDPVFVLLPHRRRRVATSFVRIERTIRPPLDADVVARHGLRMSSPARATADAARRLRDADDVAAVVTEGVRRQLFSLDELRRELDEGPTRGSRLLRIAVDGAGSGAWSPPEARLIDVCRTTSLPEPARNVVVLSAAGEYLARPDAWFDDVALAIEVDSREHHGDGDGWRRTLARQRRCAAHGVIVVPVTPREIASEPAAVAQAIVSAYAAAALRPRPPVRVRQGRDQGPEVREPRRWAG